MPTAQEILATARSRSSARDAAYTPIDYDAANKEYRQQKAALTRAVNSGDPEKVLLACNTAVEAWNKPARSWPDDWSRWQRALDDAMGFGQAPLLEDLGRA